MSVLVGVISALLIIALVVIMVLRIQYGNNIERKQQVKYENEIDFQHMILVAGTTSNHETGKNNPFILGTRHLCNVSFKTRLYY